MRKRIYDIIEKANENDTLSNIYDVFMILVIVASLIPLAFKQEPNVFKIIDKITVKNESINIKFKIRLEDYLPTDPTKIRIGSNDKTTLPKTIGSDSKLSDLSNAENSGFKGSLPKTVDPDNIL